LKITYTISRIEPKVRFNLLEHYSAASKRSGKEKQILTL